MKATFTPSPEQRALIDLEEGCHLVKAPPGTGKTQVLTLRIVRLLNREPESTFRVLALTFTTKAAETLRTRVRENVGDRTSRVKACTFHAFCMDVLQHYGQHIGFPSDTTVYESDDERLAVLARALVDQGLEVPAASELKSRLERIGMAKRALKSPNAVDDPTLRSSYEAYSGLLTHFHSCDFDDLLWLTWRLFVEAPQVARLYRRLYRYIMVDEAQDTSRAQYEILKAICADEHRNVMLVADSDQFIYRFAGASDQWLAAFVRDFGATEHRLVQNFRCARAVTEVAGRLMPQRSESNGGVASDSTHQALGLVQAVSFRDEHSEAVGVVDWIANLLSSGLDPSTLYTDEASTVTEQDVCVLARTRYSLDRIIGELNRRGIAYLFSVGRRLVESPEGELALKILKVLQNPADDVTKQALLETWTSDEGAQETFGLNASALLERVVAQHPELSALQHALDSAGPTVDVVVLVRGLIDALDILAGAQRQNDPDRALALGNDATTLRERLKQYMGHTPSHARSLGGFLSEVSLAGKSVIEGPGVRVLTVHVAKGLEFKAVALVGMNQGTLPDYRSVHKAEDLQDERRITYVAATRASRALLITRPRERVMPWGDTRPQYESVFIQAMGLTMEARP